MARENIEAESAKRITGAADVSGSGAKNLVKAVLFNRVLGGGKSASRRPGAKTAADYYNEEKLYKAKAKIDVKKDKSQKKSSRKQAVKMVEKAKSSAPEGKTVRSVRLDQKGASIDFGAAPKPPAQENKASNRNSRDLKTMTRQDERRRGTSAPSKTTVKPAAKPKAKPAAKTTAKKPAVKQNPGMSYGSSMKSSKQQASAGYDLNNPV